MRIWHQDFDELRSNRAVTLCGVCGPSRVSPNSTVSSQSWEPTQQVVPVVPTPGHQSVVREHNTYQAIALVVRQPRPVGPADGTSVVIPFREDNDRFVPGRHSVVRSAFHCIYSVQFHFACRSLPQDPLKCFKLSKLWGDSPEAMNLAP